MTDDFRLNVEVSVVIPAYKECENLALLLPKLKKVLSSISHEVIVIDAVACDNKTSNLCKDLDVEYINRTPSDFYGDAIRTGFKNVTGKYTVVMDADGSHSPEFILKMLPEMGNNDLIIASRYMPGGSTKNIKSLVFLSQIVNKVFSLLLNLKLYDVSNSYRCYTSNQLSSLCLKCNNFDIVEEILFKLIKSKDDFKVQELPFDFDRRIYGKSKRSFIVFVVSYIKTLILLRFGKL